MSINQDSAATQAAVSAIADEVRTLAKGPDLKAARYSLGFKLRLFLRRLVGLESSPQSGR